MKYIKTFESYNYSNYEKIDEGIMDFFNKVKSKFIGKESEIKEELKDKLDIDQNTPREEVDSKIKELIGNSTRSEIIRKAKMIGGILGQVIEWSIYIYVYWNWGDQTWVIIAFVIWFFIRYKVIGSRKV
jgi:hypothetical protein